MAKAKNAAAQSAATYTVREPLRHDGIDYQPGDSIELPEGQAAILIAQDVVAVLLGIGSIGAAAPEEAPAPVEPQ